MAVKTGLGKGLGALLGNNGTEIKENEEIKEGEVIQNLKLIDVEPNKNQPRIKFDDEALEELATSIKQYGVIQPIIVTKQGKYYQIVAGERRWRASKKAGLAEIPAIVRDYTEKTNREVALIENIQREDLNPIEKAKAIKELLDKYNLTQQKLADMLGMGRSSIANSIRILNLDDRIIELIMQGKLTEGHCKMLLVIEDSDLQYEVAKKIIKDGDSVRDLERFTKQRIMKKQKKETTTKYEVIYRDIESSFRNFFGTKVRLEPGKKSGKIVINYNSNDELSRILELVK